MSWREVGTAIELAEQHGFHPSARFVLLVVAWHQNTEVNEAWPSVTRLVRETGLSRRSVFYAVDVLEQAKVLERTSGQKRGRANRYRLVGKLAVKATEGVQPLHPPIRERGAAVAPPPVQPVQGRGAAVAPRTVKGTVRLNRERKVATPPARTGGDPVPMRGVFAGVLGALEARTRATKGDG